MFTGPVAIGGGCMLVDRNDHPTVGTRVAHLAAQTHWHQNRVNKVACVRIPALFLLFYRRSIDKRVALCNARVGIVVLHNTRVSIIMLQCAM